MWNNNINLFISPSVLRAPAEQTKVATIVTAQLNLNSTQLNSSWSDYIITVLPTHPTPPHHKLLRHFQLELSWVELRLSWAVTIF